MKNEMLQLNIVKNDRQVNWSTLVDLCSKHSEQPLLNCGRGMKFVEDEIDD